MPCRLGGITQRATAMRSCAEWEIRYTDWASGFLAGWSIPIFPSAKRRLINLSVIFPTAIKPTIFEPFQNAGINTEYAYAEGIKSGMIVQ